MEFDRKADLTGTTRNLFVQKQQCKNRDRMKVAAAAKKAYSLRGLRMKPKTSKQQRRADVDVAVAGRGAPRLLRERKGGDEAASKFAFKARMKTGTNFKKNPRSKAEKLAFSEPCKTSTTTTTTTITATVPVDLITIRHVLARYRRKSDLPQDSTLPCCTAHVKLFNTESGMISNAQCLKLIGLLLQRGCVEVHPGPHKSRRIHDKPGTHYSHKRTAGGFEVNRVTKVLPDAAVSSDDDYVQSEPLLCDEDVAVQEAVNASNGTTTTQSSQSTRAVSKQTEEDIEMMLPSPPTGPPRMKAKPAEQKPGSSGSPSPPPAGPNQPPVAPPPPPLDGHNMTDEESRIVCMRAFNADPRTLKRQRFVVSPQTDSRIVIDRNVKSIGQSFILETMDFECVREGFCIWFLPQALLTVRMSGTFWGFFHLAWLVVKMLPIWLTFALITGYWLFSVWHVAITLVVANFAAFQILEFFSHSDLIWGKHRAIFIPHLLTCVISSNGNGNPDTANLEQTYARCAAILIPDTEAMNYKIATCKIAKALIPLAQGFRPIGESADTIKTPYQDSSMYGLRLPRSYSIVAQAPEEPDSPVFFSRMSSGFAKLVHDHVGPAVQEHLRLATGTASLVYPTSPPRLMETQYLVRCKALADLKTSVGFPTGMSPDTAPYPPTETMLRQLLWASIEELADALLSNASLGPSGFSKPIPGSMLPSLAKLLASSPHPKTTLTALGLMSSTNSDCGMPYETYVTIDLPYRHRAMLKDSLSLSPTQS